MGKFDKTDQQFAAEAFKRRFPLEKAWSDAAREASAEARHGKGQSKDDVQAHDKPLAAAGLKSYRLKGPYGYVMIGAKDHDDAMREAARSTASPKRENLEMWDTGDKKYKPV